MRVLTWNLRKSSVEGPAWKIISNRIKPNLMLLQDVLSVPSFILNDYNILSRKACDSSYKQVNYSTLVGVKGKIIKEVKIESDYKWVNEILNVYSGNLISCTVKLSNTSLFNVVSIYNPAWALDITQYPLNQVKKFTNECGHDTHLMDFFWSALKNANFRTKQWIIGGDYNNSITFDKNWQNDNNIRYGIHQTGIKERFDKISALGFKECLNKITPTFRNPKGGKIDHQIDHLFVTEPLYAKLTNCIVGSNMMIFEDSISDHLPIIADFKD